MTAKKEKPSYEIKITRRATVDEEYNFYEFEAIIDPAKIDGVKAVRDIEKIVTFARELTATEKPKTEAKKPAKTKKKEVKEEPESTEDIKIADLQAGDKINISVRLLKVGETKRFKSGEGTYCKVDVEDSSGKIQLTLFGEQITQVQNIKRNAWLVIENGYVKEYQGKLELSVGQWGKMEVVYNG